MVGRVKVELNWKGKWICKIAHRYTQLILSVMIILVDYLFSFFELPVHAMYIIASRDKTHTQTQEPDLRATQCIFVLLAIITKNSQQYNPT